MRSLHDVPSEISSFLQEIDFFELVLPDISAKKAPGAALERKAPRIPQTVSPDLQQSAARRKGIARGNRVLKLEISVIYIDPQHLAQKRLQVLPFTQRVSFAAAVAQADVEKAIRTEGQLPAFVVGEWLIDREQDTFACRVGLVGVRC